MWLRDAKGACGTDACNWTAAHLATCEPQVAYKDRALAAAIARAERERAAARQRDDELRARVAGVQAELQAHVVQSLLKSCASVCKRPVYCSMSCLRERAPGGSTQPRQPRCSAACAVQTCSHQNFSTSRRLQEMYMQGQLQALRVENERLAAARGEAAALQCRLADAERAAADAQTLNEALTLSLEAARAETARTGDALAGAAGAKAAADSALTNACASNKALTLSLEEARAEAAGLAGARAAADSALADAQALATTLETSLEQARCEAAGLRCELGGAADARAAADSALADAVNLIKTLEGSLEEARGEAAGLRDVLADAASARSLAQLQLAALQARPMHHLSWVVL